MGRASEYKDRCSNPQCINGGARVDLSGNPECWIETSKSVLGFCSAECRSYYQAHEEEILEAKRYQEMVKKDNERYEKRYHEELVQGIYLCSDKKLDKQIISKFVKLLRLESEVIKRKLSRRQL